MVGHDDVSFVPGKEWVGAGHAIFTVKNPAGQSFTFRVKRVDDEGGLRPPIWFGSVLTGPNNDEDYTYAGIVDVRTGALRRTKNSRISEDTTSFQVFRWALKVIWAGLADKLPHGYGIHGAGRCGRCGRLLTRPEGIAPDGYRLGFGEECWRKMHGGRA